MEQTKGSLKNFFYDKEYVLERDRFLQLHGTGEAQILAADGTVNNVRLCKEDATDEAGRQIWVMSVQVNWDHVNLACSMRLSVPASGILTVTKTVRL